MRLQSDQCGVGLGESEGTWSDLIQGPVKALWITMRL